MKIKDIFDEIVFDFKGSLSKSFISYDNLLVINPIEQEGFYRESMKFFIDTTGLSKGEFALFNSSRDTKVIVLMVNFPQKKEYEIVFYNFYTNSLQKVNFWHFFEFIAL
jgi:hypothetical protein